MKQNNRSTKRIALYFALLGASVTFGLAGCANGPRDMFSKIFHRNDDGTTVAVLPEEGERLVSNEGVDVTEIEESAVVNANDPSIDEIAEPAEEPTEKIGLGSRIKGWFKRGDKEDEELAEAEDSFLNEDDLDEIFAAEDAAREAMEKADELNESADKVAEAINDFDAAEQVSDAAEEFGSAAEEKFNSAFEAEMARIDEMMKREEAKHQAEEQKLLDAVAAMQALEDEEDLEEAKEEAEELAEELAEANEFASLDTNPFEAGNTLEETTSEDVNPFEQLAETTQDALAETEADVEQPGIIRFDLSEGLGTETAEAEVSKKQVIAKELFEAEEEEAAPELTIPQVEIAAEETEIEEEVVTFVSTAESPVIEETVPEVVIEEEPETKDQFAALNAFGLTEKGKQVPVFDWSEKVEATSTQTAVNLQNIEALPESAQPLDNISEFSGSADPSAAAALNAKETQKTLRWIGVCFAVITVVLLLRRRSVA